MNSVVPIEGTISNTIFTRMLLFGISSRAMGLRKIGKLETGVLAPGFDQILRLCNVHNRDHAAKL